MAVQKNIFNGSTKKLKTSVGPVDRKKATLEAEKGETVLTNLSENDNIYELKSIAGKKHTKGGTPLDLPSGDDNGKSASFIFSDNKKLLMKDKEELEFFGVKSKKGMTPAEISKIHIDAIAKSKAIIKDMYADKIQKRSAEKNLDNSRFALSALALWQESKKGMKDGFSEHFLAFFDKTKTTPDDIFKVDEQQQAAVGEQMEAAFGGFLEKRADGGDEKSKLSKLKERVSANPFVYGYNNDRVDENGNPMSSQQVVGAGVGISDKSGLHGSYSTELPIGDFKNRTTNQSIGITKNVGPLRGDVTLHNQSYPNAPINPSGEASLSFRTNNPTGLNASVGIKNSMLPKDLWNPQVAAGVTYNFSEGGQPTNRYTIVGLPKFDEAGTVKYKVYTKDNLPKDAVIKKADATSFKVGDFVEQPDGTYKKVGYLNTQAKTVNTKTSGKNLISEWSQDAANAETLRIANQAIIDGLNAGTITGGKKDKNGNWSGNIKITGKFNPDFKTKIAISKVLNQSGKDFSTDKFKIVSQGATDSYSVANPNKTYRGTGSFVAGFTPEDYEKRYLLEKSKASGLTEEEAFKVVDDTFADPTKRLANKKEFTSFLGVTAKDDKDLMADDFYKRNFSSVTKGIENKLQTSDDYRPVYSNDAISGFEHFDAFGFSAKPDFEIEPLPKKEDVYTKTDPEHLQVKPPMPGKWDFRRQDIASLNRAINAKNNIKKYDPYSKVGQTQMPDTIFYSPERKIAAINSQLGQTIAGLNAFATPGQFAGAASEIQGKAYEQVANAISDDADKNVGLFNAAEDRNTQLANIANAQDAANATSMHDKRQTLRQQFDNSISAAKDKIVELSNAAWTNASNIFNMNQTTDNFKKDIATGIIYNSSGKPITPKTTSGTTVPELYAKYVQAMPGVDPDIIAKMVMGEKRGDFKIEDVNDPNNQTKTPEELIRLQQYGTNSNS